MTFFNQPWRVKQLPEGTQVVVFGKVERFRGRCRMTNPVVDLVGDRTGRIVPVYPQSEKAGLISWEIGDWVSEALRRAQAARGPAARASGGDRLDLVGRDWAMHQIHAPDSMARQPDAPAGGWPSTSCCGSS